MRGKCFPLLLVILIKEEEEKDEKEERRKRRKQHKWLTCRITLWNGGQIFMSLHTYHI